MDNTKYLASFKRPEWQKRRLEIMERDSWACKLCGDTQVTLNVHHKWYEFGKLPWEYPDECLETLCDHCHEMEHECKREHVSTLINTILNKGCFYDDLLGIAAVIYDMDRSVFAKRFNIKRMKTKREES